MLNVKNGWQSHTLRYVQNMKTTYLGIKSYRTNVTHLNLISKAYRTFDKVSANRTVMLHAILYRFLGLKNAYSIPVHVFFITVTFKHIDPEFW